MTYLVPVARITHDDVSGRTDRITYSSRPSRERRIPNDRCCTCGGGTHVVDEDADGELCSLCKPTVCAHNNEPATNVQGDTCAYYDDAFLRCGWYDVSSCRDTDGDATDVGGDSCTWYTANSTYCGQYDDDDFTSTTMCCAWYVDTATRDGSLTDRILSSRDRRTHAPSS